MKNDYRNNAFEIFEAYEMGRVEESINLCSTAETCILALTEPYNLTYILPGDKTQAIKEMIKLQQQGFNFNVNNAMRTSSPHREYLKEAKRILIDEILSEENPRVSKKVKVILNLGAALNHQIDKHPLITDKSNIPDNIHWKLEYLELKKDKVTLFSKYKDLNQFYNASKHQQKLENKTKLELLKNPLGKKITIDYYETIRRIFKWYYGKYSAIGVPKWDELKLIKFSDYGLNYRFTYRKRWI